jgi:hypothetical protein
MDKGFVIIAQDGGSLETYQKCADALAKSIKRTMPDAKVSIITDNKIKNKSLYDKVIPLPYGDQAPKSYWKLNNDWQVYDASPYEYTIKLEADIYLPSSIDYWWNYPRPEYTADSLMITNCLILTTQSLILKSLTRQRTFLK